VKGIKLLDENKREGYKKKEKMNKDVNERI
jgi:hypothetical protein